MFGNFLVFLELFYSYGVFLRLLSFCSSFVEFSRVFPAGGLEFSHAFSIFLRLLGFLEFSRFLFSDFRVCSFFFRFLGFLVLVGTMFPKCSRVS